jgi:hypothetical protein
MSQHSPPYQTLALLRASVLQTVKRVGFWGTIVLPLTYLPVLSGAVGDDMLLTLTGLLCLNLLCLVVSRNYAR